MAGVLTNGTATTNRQAISELSMWGLQGLWGSDLVKPEHEKDLAVMFPECTLTAFVDLMDGMSKPSPNEIYTWSEQNRTRKSCLVTASVIVGGGASAVLTLDIPIGSPYFQPNDTIFTSYTIGGNPLYLFITAVDNALGTISVVPVNGTTLLTALMFTAPTNAISHAGTQFGEGSNAPLPRTWFPELRKNKMGISRRTAVITGTAMAQSTWIENFDDVAYKMGNGKYVLKDEYITLQEMQVDHENMALFSEYSPDNNTSNVPTAGNNAGINTQSGEGIVRTVLNRGIVGTYSGAVTEADIIAMITSFRLASVPCSEFSVFCGAEYQLGAQIALKDYAINGTVQGASSYEALKAVGINIQSYRIGGTVINFIPQARFDDNVVFPFRGTTGLNATRFPTFALWLNMSDKKNRIEHRYHAGNGLNRKIWGALEVGLVGLSGQSVGNIKELSKDFGIASHNFTINTATDKMSSHVMRTSGWRVPCAHWHGAQYAV